MSGLASVALSGLHNRADAFLRGDAVLSLTPTAGGAAVAFLHDEEGDDAETTEAGGLEQQVMGVFTDTRLAVRKTYTYGGHTWTVDVSEPDIGGGATLKWRSVLTRHAAAT